MVVSSLQFVILGFIKSDVNKTFAQWMDDTEKFL